MKTPERDAWSINFAPLQRRVALAIAMLALQITTAEHRMAHVGRNERCPCGSGKKFKHCCLLVQSQPSLESLTARRLGRLADWIAAKFRSQIPAQADELYFEFDAEERELLNSGDHAGSNGVSTLLTDFICIDGEFELRGVTQTGLDWYLEASGPMSLEDREFYEALSLSGLRAYRVVSVNPGEGMELLDLFADEMEVAFVYEKLGSTQIAVNDVLGARIVASDGVLQFAFVVPFHPDDGDLLMENYVEDLALVRAQAGFLDDVDDVDDVDDENDENEEVEEEKAAIDDAIARYALAHEGEGTAANEAVTNDAALGDAAPEAQSDLDDGAEDEKDDALEVEAEDFDEVSVRNIFDAMNFQDIVAARVVSTYWLESVLNSLRPPTLESAADE